MKYCNNTEQNNYEIFTVYDFLCLFSASLNSQSIFSFHYGNVLSFILKCKEIGCYENILADFDITKKDTIQSNKMLYAIKQLELNNILYSDKLEEDSIVWIDKKIPVTELLVPRMHFFEEMTEFIHDFQDFEIKKATSSCSQLAEQEDIDIDRAIHSLNRVLLKK